MSLRPVSASIQASIIGTIAFPMARCGSNRLYRAGPGSAGAEHLVRRHRLCLRRRQTSGTGGLDGIFIKDVDEQLNQFLPASTTKVDPNALYVMFAGANDLINGQTNVSVPVGRLNQDLGRLVNAGARNFLVANLPLLGYTPRYDGNPTTFASYNTLSTQFNSSLDVVLDNLQAGNSALPFIAWMWHRSSIRRSPIRLPLV